MQIAGTHNDRAMYSIRVRAGGEVLEAVFSGEVTTSEALRAVSHAYSLAEAGGISRALCDLRSVETGPLPSISVIAASFATRFSPGERVAMLCTEEQLNHARQFARFARMGEELGVFTRLGDAEEWLASQAYRRLSRTALQHFDGLDVPETPAPTERRRASA